MFCIAAGGFSVGFPSNPVLRASKKHGILFYYKFCCFAAGVKGGKTPPKRTLDE